MFKCFWAICSCFVLVIEGVFFWRDVEFLLNFILAILKNIWVTVDMKCVMGNMLGEFFLLF